MENNREIKLHRVSRVENPVPLLLRPRYVHRELTNEYEATIHYSRYDVTPRERESERKERRENDREYIFARWLAWRSEPVGGLEILIVHGGWHPTLSFAFCIRCALLSRVHSTSMVSTVVAVLATRLALCTPDYHCIELNYHVERRVRTDQRKTMEEGNTLKVCETRSEEFQVESIQIWKKITQTR